MQNSTSRCSRQEINAMVLYDSRNVEGARIGQHLQKGDWVNMQPSTIRVHQAKCQDAVEKHLKGRIVGFKTSKEEQLVAIVPTCLFIAKHSPNAATKRLSISLQLYEALYCIDNTKYSSVVFFN